MKLWDIHSAALVIIFCQLKITNVTSKISCILSDKRLRIMLTE